MKHVKNVAICLFLSILLAAAITMILYGNVDRITDILMWIGALSFGVPTLVLLSSTGLQSNFLPPETRDEIREDYKKMNRFTPLAISGVIIIVIIYFL